MATVNNKIQYSKSDKVFGFVNGALQCLLMFVLLYPMYFCLVASFSHPNAVAKGLVTMWPVDASLDAYKFAFQEKPLWRGYGNSIYYTLFGTIFNLVLTIPASPEDYTVFAESGIGRIEVDGMHIIGSDTLGSGENRLDLEGGIGNIDVYFEP